MIEKIIIAGAGGQGNLFMGEVLSVAVLKENKNVTFFPSYGPQMRGGKSTATVVIADKEIGSPIVASPDVLIVMNGPSLDYVKDVRQGGLIIINSSLAEYQDERKKDVDILKVYTATILERLKTPKVLNMILLGVYVRKSGMVKIKAIVEAMEEELREEGKGRFIEVNKAALMAGYEYFS